MNGPLHKSAAAAFAIALAAPLAAHTAPPATQWVTSWHASPQPVWNRDFVLPTNIPAELADMTIREHLRLSSGGRRLRLVFSNRYGSGPLEIGEVHVALAGSGADEDAGTDHAVTFSGQRSISVPPGAQLVSDPVAFDVPALGRLSVSTYLPSRTALSTFHWGDQQTAYIASGNATGSRAMRAAQGLKGRFFLTDVLVDAPPQTRVVAALGDSITDGNGSTPDLDRRWPDYLAQRLAGANVAVVNAGISGARVLGDLMGANALARVADDVLSQPGMSTLILLMGINDIGWPGSAFAPNDAPMSAEHLIVGYRQLAASARAHNIRIVGATLLPFEGALAGTPSDGHFSPEKDRVRQAVNRWIRTSGEFDAVVDFDALMRDPARPSRMLPAYDSGDHLHPGDEGYRTMAQAIDVALLFGDAGRHGER